MDKDEMLRLIDEHKNKMIDPVAMLNWTWLRVFILSIPDEEFDTIMERAVKVLRR